jgi:2-polyprenyl-3-methyl-5-hydroxy-6-metoxy-1,4-benzoquinol methylase
MEIATKCAVCSTHANSEIVFAATVDSNSLTSETFSARRIPDRKYFQWVRCNLCGLLRSDPISDIDLKELYQNSTFDYSQELHGLKNSYSKLVLKAIPKPNGKVLIEIGGGNGFFLEEALELGFESVVEIEPSLHAYNQASETVKKFFITDVLKPGLVSDQSADIVVIFHVLDHLPDPLQTLKLVNNLLKPGGRICIAVHNVNSISAKLLKSKSPIFDVEHLYLYSKSTISQILDLADFSNIKVGHYKNSYSLSYLLHLLPLSRKLKIKILNSKIGNKMQLVRLTVPLGNMYAIAEKKDTNYGK